ncbi:MAG: hypothetical protein K7J15_05505, partial [Candidatus Regiella insecticola]|nr:hypothetical protein [Candidatus Regiella insecticola]
MREYIIRGSIGLLLSLVRSDISGSVIYSDKRKVVRNQCDETRLSAWTCFCICSEDTSRLIH